MRIVADSALNFCERAHINVVNFLFTHTCVSCLHRHRRLLTCAREHYFMNIEALLSGLEVFLDPWVLFGFAAQAVFFSRFVYQWYVSERAGTTVIPRGFWYLSIVGALMILVYAIRQGDIVFTVGQFAALAIYVRNLMIANKSSGRAAAPLIPERV